MKWSIVFGVFFGCAAGAHGQVVIPPSSPIGWSVGATNTTAFHWDNFNLGGTYPGPLAPDAASFHPGLPNASLIETTGLGFPTGGGNIYSPSAPLAFTVTLPNYGFSVSPGGPWTTTIFVQTRTLGSEVDYPNLNLTWIDGGGSHTLNTSNAFLSNETERVALGGFGGFSVTHIWGFNVPNNPAQFTLAFAAASSSMSFDQLRVDTLTSPVPEPSAMLLAGAAMTIGWWRRKGKR